MYYEGQTLSYAKDTLFANTSGHATARQFPFEWVSFHLGKMVEA
jgi:hypothetical protein